MVEKIQSKLAGWKASLLSSGSRLLLIMHVFPSIPIYTLSILEVPNSIINKLDSIFANFFWGSTSNERKHHCIAWKNNSNLWQMGVLGFLILIFLSTP
jgi:hypothetical protein